MPACERCWRDSAYARFSGDSDAYARLVASRKCSPADQAGPEARLCGECGERTVHQYAGVCMACGWNEMSAALAGGERAQHSKHPTGDYCVYCRAQWPCAEAEGGER